MIQINTELTPAALLPGLETMWRVSEKKILDLHQNPSPDGASPVYTIGGRYTSKGWTEWTQGFEFGSALLQFDATGDREFLEIGRKQTVEKMAAHVSHVGVHDHGFNNISTYGNLYRMMLEEKIPFDGWELEFYQLALKASGAVQAARWTELGEGEGYIYSFNGPHSLFADTIRSCRALSMAHRLGHVLMGERDRAISLLSRMIAHAECTAKYNVWYGEGRDAYDIRGRVAHESIFNLNDKSYRCPSSQQGYSPFSTWTRGLSWIMLGYPEQIEFLQTLTDEELEPYGGRDRVRKEMLKTAKATCDFYIEQTPSDGIPYWDTGAPLLHRLGGDYLSRPADPFNDHEPVDSSAAAIGAQGLLRLGCILKRDGDIAEAERYFAAGLTIAKRLLEEPYLSTDESHQGLLLHGVYHRPNDWDYIPEGRKVPCGEANMWGDYHLRELALLVQRLAENKNLYFFGPVDIKGKV